MMGAGRFDVNILKTSTCSQGAFAAIVGISQPRVSNYVAEGVLKPGGTVIEWLLAYCHRLREQAAGRAGEGGLDLAQERAALARSQRIGQELKNAVTQGEYAPIGLLADVLSAAAAAVTDRFDALPGDLRRTCPDLSDDARTVVESAIASARNEWVRSTSSILMKQLDDMDGPADDEDGHE
jgi:phage terminase Nu1 subunit (DNA packaging protein)